MVLVAPRPLLRPAPSGDAPVDRGTGAEVLALLRGDTAARPRFDPGLAGGLRAWLEDAAYDVSPREASTHRRSSSDRANCSAPPMNSTGATGAS